MVMNKETTIWGPIFSADATLVVPLVKLIAALMEAVVKLGVRHPDVGKTTERARSHTRVTKVNAVFMGDPGPEPLEFQDQRIQPFYQTPKHFPIARM